MELAGLMQLLLGSILADEIVAKKFEEADAIVAKKFIGCMIILMQWSLHKNYVAEIRFRNLEGWIEKCDAVITKNDSVGPCCVAAVCVSEGVMYITSFNPTHCL